MRDARTAGAGRLAGEEPAPPLSARTQRLLDALRTLLEHLPQGQLLPEHIWRRRHSMIVVVLWFHVVGLTAFGLTTGQSLPHVLGEGAVIALAAWVAGSQRVGTKLRVASASFGLITSSAVLVHLSGGLIESHFHFFVMIGLLTLYQDWTPYLLAIGYVVLHHGVGGVLAPESVYNHPDAVAHPWRWALVHAAFVLAASATHIVAWRTNENQLLRDPLTGLPSRVLFLRRLAVSLERLRRRPGGRVAVLFLDLDRFKVINDSLGHPSGDKLLVAVAERLRHALRRHETLARFGGDEFAILCEDIGDQQDAIAVAERVLKSFGLPFSLEDGEASTTASLGIAVTASANQDGGDLIRDADAAMYRAKEQGGGRYLLFDEVTRTRAIQRLELENALRRALDRDEFRVFFQPEVSVDTEEIIGVEALVRWEHPERGLLAPGEFIALAEETGLIVPIGGWVLSEACRLAQRWQAGRPDDAPLTLRVNVSARQLAEDGLPDIVAGVLAESEMDPALLCLEVTESVLIEDPDSSTTTLSALKALGVQLAVDDFGTGYSSLEYLRRFPVDCLKIDRSYIRGLPHSSEDSAIVTAVVELGHALSLSVTAEGVESADQLVNLRARGCDSAQGFLFARPEPPEVVEQLLGQRLAPTPLVQAG
ncbi:MAG TPA: EAL domain-containing protein [Thermoleophilaceae bacterium]|nr:EAL domain-containing protein [Thermoleophilaceae bacterium]